MSGKDAAKASAALGARHWRPELRSLTPKVSSSDTISRKAWGHGAVAIEPPHVGRMLRQLKKLTEVSAHEIFTVVTEIYFPDLWGEPSICRDASLRGRPCISFLSRWVASSPGIYHGAAIRNDLNCGVITALKPLSVLVIR